MKAWIKGGLIGATIFIVVGLIFIIGGLSNYHLQKGLYFVISMGQPANSAICYLMNHNCSDDTQIIIYLAYSIMGIFLNGFILGSLIGFIEDKFKSKNKRKNES